MKPDNTFLVMAVTVIMAVPIVTLILASPIPGSSDLIADRLLAKDGLLGGLIALCGTLIAGYWAFKAQSENTRALLRAEILRRNREFARDIRKQISYILNISFLVKNDLSRYLLQQNEYPDIKLYEADLPGKIAGHLRPELDFILPDQIESEINACINILNGAATMLQELFKQYNLLLESKFIQQPFLAHTIDDVKELVAAADIKILFIQTFYEKIRHHDGERLPQFKLSDVAIEKIALTYGWKGDQLLARLRKRSEIARQEASEDRGSVWQNIIRSSMS